jgi:peroxin-11B
VLIAIAALSLSLSVCVCLFVCRALCVRGWAVFRMGKPLENVNNVLKALSAADPVVRATTVGRNVFLGLWLLQDMFQWVRTPSRARRCALAAPLTPCPYVSIAVAGRQLHAVGFIKVEDIKTLNTNASRAWFVGLVFSVALDLHKLRMNAAKQAKARAAASTAADADAARRDARALVAERRGLLLDLVRDVLDLSIPGSALEYVKIETGTVGILGAVTSAIGVYQNWPSAAGK